MINFIRKISIMSIIAMAYSSCMPDAETKREGTAAQNNNISFGKSKEYVEVPTQNVSVIRFTASKDRSQTIEGAKGSSIKGSYASFAPKTLPEDVDILMESGVRLSEPAVLEELGYSDSDFTLLSASNAVYLEPEKHQNPLLAVSIGIPLSKPSDSTLRLDNREIDLELNLVVIYRIRDSSKGKIITGIIPTKEISLEKNTAKFKSSYFGTFQLAYTDLEIEEQKETVSKKKFLSARQEKNKLQQQ